MEFGTLDASQLPIAASMAANGIATVVINLVGHGFGRRGTLTVDQSVGGAVTFPAGGRGIDQNHDHRIDSSEGLAAAPPRSVISNRDGEAQTVADYMQLVRVIEIGMEVDGDGTPDLDPNRIYFFGQSFGGICGVNFLAIEPDVRLGDLTSMGGPIFEYARLSPVGRSGSFLASRTPPLLNPPGIAEIDSVAVPAPYFNENLPLRNSASYAVHLEDGTERLIQSPVVNDIPGAMAIQEVLEEREWVMQPGNPLVYAPYLRKHPLPAVPAKSVIVQFAKGDQTIPNPTETTFVRAGDLADRVTFYRHDLAFAENPRLPTNPHVFMVGSPPPFRTIALGAQQQIAVFLASDGTEIIHPKPARFFEVPIAGPLPEELNFIP